MGARRLFSREFMNEVVKLVIERGAVAQEAKNQGGPAARQG